MSTSNMDLRTDSETDVPASPVYHSCPTSPISRPRSAASQRKPLQYRIEERRRTVFVTSDEPPTFEEISKIFSLADISEGDSERFFETFAVGNTTDGESIVVEQINPIASSPLDLEDSSSPDSEHQLGISTPIAMHAQRKTVITALKAADRTITPPSSPTQRSGSGSPRTPVHRRILFYHKQAPYYGFTNFSPHPVFYKGKRYPTSEHLFQSFKFQEHRPDLAEHIRLCSEWPSVAFREARRFQPEVRRDWKDVNIKKMDETLWHKFSQHRDLRGELLATGDAELVEDSDKDAFWGIGPDGLGCNELGKALERLRARLRNGDRSPMKTSFR